MKETKEPGSKIPFKNVLKFIETGESANITIKRKEYNISVNREDGLYYIDGESFENRDEFIEAIYNKTSVKLKENTIIILNSIADGNIKVDSSWKFEGKDKEQVNSDEKKKYKLRRNMIIILILWYFIAGSVIYTNIKELIYNEDSNINIYTTAIKTIYRNRVHYPIKIVARISIISMIFVFFLEDNRRRIKMLFKYSKEDMKKIEDEVLDYIDKNTDFCNIFDRVGFLEDGLYLMRKTNLRVIKYEDIKYIFLMKYNIISSGDSFGKGKLERKVCIVTKDNKMIALVDIIHREKFVKEILKRNPNIIYKKTRTIKKKEYIDLEDVTSINKSFFKSIFFDTSRIFIKGNAILMFFFCVIHNTGSVSSIDNRFNTIIAVFVLIPIYTVIVGISDRLRRKETKKINKMF